jgi:hypothetical protein
MSRNLSLMSLGGKTTFVLLDSILLILEMYTRLMYGEDVTVVQDYCLTSKISCTIILKTLKVLSAMHGNGMRNVRLINQKLEIEERVLVLLIGNS